MRKLLLFLLIFIIYFVGKFCLYVPLTVSDGVVVRIGTFVDSSINLSHTAAAINYPVILFKDKTGNADTTTDTDPGSFFDTYKIGDNVQVCYKSAHPEKARLYSFFTYWLPIGNLGLLILACLVWIGISRIFSKKLND